MISNSPILPNKKQALANKKAPSVNITQVDNGINILEVNKLSSIIFNN